MRTYILTFFCLTLNLTLFAQPELQYVELQRCETGPRLSIRGELSVHEMVEPGPYQLVVASCSVNQTIPNLRMDSEGHLVIAATQAPFVLSLDGLEWGDAVRLSLRPQRGGTRAELVMIPFPIQVRDKDGHWALLTRLDPYGSTFSLHVGGYEPGEAVTLLLSIDQERRQQPLQMRTDGSCETVIQTRAHSQSGGVAYLSIDSEHSSLPLAYHWGGPGGR